MPLKAEIAPQLPFLRRYARALTGSQMLGDQAVRDLLEALVAAPEQFDRAAEPRAELFRLFHRLWRGRADGSPAGGLIGELSLHTREALLLTVIEAFTVEQTAVILASSAASISAEIEAARGAIAEGLYSKVLIIEDETIIALDIKSIVESLGHNVSGIARTRSEATVMAAELRPELILADISLADGSSGIGAVNDIMVLDDLPVIFITAFPERLLTGERPEPTYLITKPFSPETVAATIGQALLFHRERTSIAAAPPEPATAIDVPDPRKHFDTPEALLTDRQLPDADKKQLLTDWDSEIDGQLNAESEGMGVSDPLSARKEGRLADEARKVKTALTAITEKTNRT